MTLREGDAPTWVSRILEAEALRPAPSAATKQAIAAGLAAARAARPAPRPPSLRIARSRAVAALAGAFTIGAFLGAGLARTAARPAPESHAPSTPVVPVPNRAEAPPTPPSQTTSELVPPGPSALPPPKAKGPAPTPSSLETQERTWLERARSAIARGDGPAALAALETHERNHPASAFAEERDALYVQALAKAARHEEANRAAARFEASYPQSIFLGNVRACRVPRAVPGDAQ